LHFSEIVLVGIIPVETNILCQLVPTNPICHNYCQLWCSIYVAVQGQVKSSPEKQTLPFYLDFFGSKFSNFYLAALQHIQIGATTHPS
jgi:hypothetical protein